MHATEICFVDYLGLDPEYERFTRTINNLFYPKIEISEYSSDMKNRKYLNYNKNDKGFQLLYSDNFDKFKSFDLSYLIEIFQMKDFYNFDKLKDLHSKFIGMCKLITSEEEFNDKVDLFAIKVYEIGQDRELNEDEKIRKICNKLVTSEMRNHGRIRVLYRYLMDLMDYFDYMRLNKSRREIYISFNKFPWEKNGLDLVYDITAFPEENEGFGESLDEKQSPENEDNSIGTVDPALDLSNYNCSLENIDGINTISEKYINNILSENISSSLNSASTANLTTIVIDKLVSIAEKEVLFDDLFNLLGDSFDLINQLISLQLQVIDWVLKDMGEPSPRMQFRQGNFQIFLKNEVKNKGNQKRKKIENLRRKLIEQQKDTPLSRIVAQGERSIEQKKFNQWENILNKLFPKELMPSGSRVFKNKIESGYKINSFETYRSIVFPVPDKRVFGLNELRYVKQSFEPWARIAFVGIEHLNIIQSKVYPIAYKTNDNMLICAPTGCGKTNIALMSILNEIGQHREENGVIRTSEFKIVYVAPMKALATEITQNFLHRLSPLNVVVKEYTGDVQLTKKEIAQVQIIVTTPEKWDVITRKTSDNSLSSLVRLLIIDEVHLLHEERGAVIEAVVARTLRQVEQNQSVIRIVGLSATLPNYSDVAQFLRVNPQNGLFYFDNSYRPVPLKQQFVGIKGDESLHRARMDAFCYDRINSVINKGKQIIIFVHSRVETVTFAKRIRSQIENRKVRIPINNVREHKNFLKKFECSNNSDLKGLVPFGIGFHNAGVVRQDRRLVENAFLKGYIRVLISTATLAWGVNLPAHTVIIKGTQIYFPEKGGFGDLGILDVVQIFGRAGRPGFDSEGEGVLITSDKKFQDYASLLTAALPIESRFLSKLANNLNAEIVLGTVTSIMEAVQWLSYSYLYVRLLKNPLAYGLTTMLVRIDPHLSQYQLKIIKDAAIKLNKSKMIRYDIKSGILSPTNAGRIASYYYLDAATIENFDIFISSKEVSSDSEPFLSPLDILKLVAMSAEFSQIRLREEELAELISFSQKCRIVSFDDPDKFIDCDKIIIMIQCYISRFNIQTFSLVSDMNFIQENASRVFRGYFELFYKCNWPNAALKCHEYYKMIEHRMWTSDNCISQLNILSDETIFDLDSLKLSTERLMEVDPNDLSKRIRGGKKTLKKIQLAFKVFPKASLEATVQPLTNSILKIHLTINFNFKWMDAIHGTVDFWWIWVQSSSDLRIYHSEYLAVYKKQINQPIRTTFVVLIEKPIPPHYKVTLFSDRWICAKTVEMIPLSNLVLPEEFYPDTELLPLQPLSLHSLQNSNFSKLYNFTHFNGVQTQTFHTMYYMEENVLLGSPTGSGKTVVAELAMLKLFRDRPHLKVVYIAPLKAIIRERLKDWKKRFSLQLGKNLVQLTGDYTPDINALNKADIIASTPEKWDGISRNWHKREYVKNVGLIIIDEIHLIGEDRGPIIEILVSRMRYMSTITKTPVRLVALSATISNITDLADWMGVDRVKGLFNFRSSVRPVRLEVHISGFPGRYYCPRMASMNKHVFRAIMNYSLKKPTLIFVSSRRQTRITAFALLGYCLDDPQRFLNMSNTELEDILVGVHDSSLKNTLRYGIGLHHANLHEDDKALVESLFCSSKIEILVSTATLAWGVNFPAHLVIIKGTEYYDAKTKGYVDYPMSDVLQMIGRAGRPQFDSEGYAVVFVEESKKKFYSRFLYEPFPVESKLSKSLHDHINAEIVAGTIRSKQDAIDYLTWTYFFRRLLKNPTYYGLKDLGELDEFLSKLVDTIFNELEENHCISIEEQPVPFFAEIKMKNQAKLVHPKTYGIISSFYYLNYLTMKLFHESLRPDISLEELLNVLCSSCEYSELPVRHNEDILNTELSKRVRCIPPGSMDKPSVKASLLVQAHISHLELPIADYVTDTKQVLDQSIRILQAIIEISANNGWLRTTLNSIYLLQMIVQACWIENSSLSVLPEFNCKSNLNYLASHKISHIAELVHKDIKEITNLLGRIFNPTQINRILEIIKILPVINLSYSIEESEIIGQENSMIYNIHIKMERKSKFPVEGIYAPFYPKRKDESWWLIIGNESNDKLYALKKVNTINNRPIVNSKLVFQFNSNEGKNPRIYLMSDSYIGLDQIKEVKILSSPPR